MSHGLSDDLVQTLNDLCELFRRSQRESAAETIDRERPNLMNENPGALRQATRMTLERQWKPRARRAACHRDGDDRTGPSVEHVMAENEDRALPGLLVTAHRTEVGPPDFASQYSGHASRASITDSSARRCSSAGFNFALSRARRVRARRCSLSASAASTAWLRLRNIR